MNKSISKIFLDSMKICKYEFLNSRVLLIVSIILTLLNLLVYIGKSGNNITYALLIIIQVFSFVTFAIAYVLSAAISFYHGVFGRHAYLTHSLPIDLDSMIVSKIFVFMLWALVGFIEFGLFVFALSSGYDLIEQELMNIYNIKYYVLALCNVLSELIYIFMIVAIIHRKKTHTLFFGFVTYFGIKVVLLILVASILAIMDDTIQTEHATMVSYCFTTLCIIVYYYVCRYIIKNKLSL